MHRLAFILLAAVILCSCIGIESKMTLRADGSGVLELTYRVAKPVADLGRSGSDKGPIPLPVTREDFERGIAGVAGVSLGSISRTENETDVTIRAVLTFDSVDSLAKVAAFRDAPPSLAVNASRRTYSQLIARAPAQAIDADTRKMIETFFDGYSIKLVFEAPSAIQSSSLGTLSTDKKTLTFNSTVKDLVTAAKDVTVSFSW